MYIYRIQHGYGEEDYLVHEQRFSRPQLEQAYFEAITAAVEEMAQREKYLSDTVTIWRLSTLAVPILMERYGFRRIEPTEEIVLDDPDAQAFRPDYLELGEDSFDNLVIRTASRAAVGKRIAFWDVIERVTIFGEEMASR